MTASPLPPASRSGALAVVNPAESGEITTANAPDLQGDLSLRRS